MSKNQSLNQIYENCYTKKGASTTLVPYLCEEAFWNKLVCLRPMLDIVYEMDVLHCSGAITKLQHFFTEVSTKQ